MTSRLKRKLDNMGVDVHSSGANENFCMIGTPLPPLEKADKNEFVPVWKQDVRDEKGRRRLHGAFTGGFSAGYFNTVGSKEGWAPSTFVSSRANRASASQRAPVQRPEDFMDEEDLAEHRADQKLVDVGETASSGAGLAGPGAEAGSDDVMSGIWTSLVPPTSSSPGAALLQRMGWRPGQGIGPRVTHAKRKLQDRLAAGRAGAALPPEAVDEEMDEEAEKHLYAPRDTAQVVYRAKDNSFGLGYIPGAGLRDTGSGQGSGREDLSGPTISAGFGLGALNDAEDDDVDVYEGDGARGPSDRRKVAFSLEDEDEEKVLLDSRQGPGYKRPGQSAQKAPRPTQTQYFFPDGRAVLPGFLPVQQAVTDDTWFEPPTVPDDWEPDPKRVWEHGGSVRASGALGSSGIGKAGHAGGLRIEERGAILGETPLVARSVFDYLSKEARDRLQKVSATLKAPTPEVKAESPSPEARIEIPTLEPQTAAAALRGFQPFTSDPVKQSRYTAYLQSQATASERPVELSPMLGQNIDEFNKELSDYVKAARIFKPATGAMASRFTSAAVFEVEHKPKEGLHAPEEGTYLEPKPEDAPVEEVQVKETPKQHAARMGMFGPLTRETSVWAPAKLLCKRFGVKDPYPDGLPTDEKPAGSSPWSAPRTGQTSDFPPNQPLAITAGPSNAQEGKENVPAANTKRDISNVGLGEDEEQGRDTLTYEKPGMDVFKAIFASDDEESDDEEEPPVPSVTPAATVKVESAPLSVLKNQSAAPHLTAESSSVALYNPSHPGAENALDLSSFKPTFIPKAARSKDKSEGEKVSKKDKDKDKKRKKDKHLLVSFDLEEGSVESPSRGEEERSKKRKREEREEKRKRRKEEDDQEGMWVEKPPPEIVAAPRPPTEPEPAAPANSAVSGRRRAADFF